MLVEQNGLKVKQWQDHKWLVIETAKLARCVEFINSPRFSEFDGVIVSKDLGFTSNALDFIEQTLGVSSVTISDHFDDLSHLYSLKHLRTLHLAENNAVIDVSKFEVLEEFGFDWNAKVLGLESCRRLRRLIIGEFASKDKRIAALPPLPSLLNLTIVKSNIVDLVGMDRFPSLTDLNLSYMGELVDIEGILGCNLLKSAVFEKCRKIGNHDVVQGLEKLRVLKFNDCGSMMSISFIGRMKALETFAFAETNVVDGDMRPCLKLKHAGFSDHKHFSHTFAEIQKQMQSAQPSIDPASP